MENILKQIRFEFILAWLVFLLFIRVLYDRLTAFYHILIDTSNIDYRDFEISDWLINYEGGFVRRGLIGQILLNMEQIHLYDVRLAISIICLTTSIVLLLLIVRIFKEEGWSFLILPTGFIFGFTLFRLGGRRDLLSFLLTYIIFLLFRKVVSRSGNKVVWWILFYAVSVLQILVHEASFFYTFPILMLFLFQKQRNFPFIRNCMSCLLRFMPILLAMAVVCIFKGDSNTAIIIWNSWGDVFTHFPCDCNLTVIGDGVNALTWGAQETFINHLTASYIGTHSPSYFHIPIAIFNLFAAYYLASRINAIDMGFYKNKVMDKVYMSNVLLIQFIAMIPMFTVLSCDWGRTIPYWILTSLFFYHLFKEDRIESLPFLTGISYKAQNQISSNTVLYNNYTYIILVLVTPIPFACAPFDYSNTFQQGMLNFEYIFSFMM